MPLTAPHTAAAAGTVDNDSRDMLVLGAAIAVAALVVMATMVLAMWLNRRRVAMEAELRASEARKGAIMEAALDAIITINHEGRVVEFNPAAERMFGYSRQEALGRDLAALVVPAGLRERHNQGLARYLATGHGPMLARRLEVTALRADGGEFLAEVAIARLQSSGPPLFVGFVRNIDERKRFEQALRESEERLRTVTRNAPLVLWAVDNDGIFTFSDGQMLGALGSEPGRVVGQSVYQVYGWVPQIVADHQRALAGEAFASVVAVGNLVFESHYTPLRDESGNVVGVIGVSTDVTERARAEAERDRLFALSMDMMCVAGFDGYFKRLNPAFETTLGWSTHEFLAHPFLEFVHPDDHVATQRQMDRLASGLPTMAFENRYRRKDGSWRWLTWTATPVVAEGLIYAVAHDTTERKRNEETLRHRAMHDDLTNLPNRALLQERVEQGVLAVQRDGAALALLLLDLDRFKEINDTFGHRHGDVLLRQVAERLRDTLRATDTVARLGGDEFAVLLANVDRDGALTGAEKVRAALEAPFLVDGQSLHAGASLGIALCPDHGLDAETLLRRADVAMYAAKRGGAGFAVYSSAQDQNTPERLALIAELRQAIARGELALHYQPKIDLATGAVCGLEALVRWPHPTRGLIGPDLFIPLAEQTALMGPLTLWVIEAALREGAACHIDGCHLPVAVNLSATSLYDPALPDTIAGLLRCHGVAPERLRVEVTESTLMADAKRARDVLLRLAALGVHISVDDFGTGYSSLAYLKHLPVDELKIDRSFVAQMSEDSADAAIVSSTIGLAHTLGLRVVAEGVEDGETYEALATLGCDIAQGYYLSRPLPYEALVSWLATTGQSAA